MTTKSDAEALIRRYYEICANQYSPATASTHMAEIVTDDFVFHPPNNSDGVAGLDRHREWLVWHHNALAKQPVHHPRRDWVRC